ncbi:metal-dependent hydrolase [Halosimplex salinum]|uniref:metal-dependent hydrolase n=1 Tax=Halosimplex salinum TaxID=1710538 RepID=UPI000F49C1E2|nr:metal-dependent hydrolase [Halosimplex salinum]
MAAYLGSRALFLAVAIATHGLVGYALGAALFDAPRAGLVGGVVADADLLVPTAWGPLAHRGLTHSVLAAVVAAGVAARYSHTAAGGVGVGYASQLIVDAMTPRGIPAAAPFWSTHVGVSLGGHSPEATAVLWVCSLAILWVSRDGLDGVGRERRSDGDSRR